MSGDPRVPYGLLLGVTLAVVAARICSVEADRGETPFLSANDRSRWATVRSLVEEGTYVIDNVILLPVEMPSDGDLPPEVIPPNASLPATWIWDAHWNSIDKVQHPGSDGREHFYSSKPPLLATLMAGEYWLLRQITGVNLSEHPFYMGRLMLLLTHLPLLALLLWLVSRWLEMFARHDFTRWCVFLAACGGTFCTSFAVTLNNHFPAAVCSAVVLHAALLIGQGRRHWGWFALAGFAAALVFAFELPALALLAAVGAGLLVCDWKKTLVAFVPAAVVVIAGMLVTNYAAHGTWQPAYGQRKADLPVAMLPANFSEDFESGVLSLRLTEAWSKAMQGSSPPKLDFAWTIRPQSRWSVFDHTTGMRYMLQLSGKTIDISPRRNWYEYPRSYWLDENRRGIDQGETSRATYAFHALLGHHGLFSLTPLWLFSVWGLLLGVRRGDWPAGRCIAAATLALSVVVVGFYLSLPTIDRNYGGVTCGLRWVIWLAPLWLFAAIPAIDVCRHSRWLRCVVVAALLISVFSANFSPLNPWQHPWLYRYWESIGWIGEG